MSKNDFSNLDTYISDTLGQAAVPTATSWEDFYAKKLSPVQKKIKRKTNVRRVVFATAVVAAILLSIRAFTSEKSHTVTEISANYTKLNTSKPTSEIRTEKFDSTDKTQVIIHKKIYVTKRILVTDTVKLRDTIFVKQP